jgi:hypothetical protein
MPAANFPGFGTTSGFPAAHDSYASGSVPGIGEPSAAAARKRQIIIIAGAAVAVVAGFLLVLLIAGGGKSKKSAVIGKGSGAIVDKGSADRVVATPDATVVAPDEGSNADEGSAGSGAGSQQVAIEEGSNATPPPSGACSVTVTSVPTGADIYMAKAKLGTTPHTFEHPCGTQVALTLKKPKFLATDRAFTPAAGKANKVVVRLGKPMLSLKVTSSPSGATITIAGKSAGVTPTTIKVPANEASTISLTKPGYATDSQRVTPKANGQAHHVVLKKGGRR